MILRLIPVVRFLMLLVAIVLLVGPFVEILLAGPQPDSTGVASRELPSSWSQVIGWILFALSELCSLLPGVKANGIVQLIMIVLEKVSPPKQ